MKKSVMLEKKVLIFGAGTIGSHIGYCLSSSGLIVDFIARGKHLQVLKKKGLLIKIYNNKKLLVKKNIKKSEKVNFFSSLKSLGNKKYDYIFIMNKLNNDSLKNLRQLSHFVTKKTSIIPQCTQPAFWLDKKIYKRKTKIRNDINYFYQKYFSSKKVIGMTAWVSGIIEKPGIVKIRHVQRGYPMKEVFKKNKKSCDYLRNKIKKYCKSPNVKDIRSEIFIKSINALAFNLVALNTMKNNKQLYMDQSSKDKICKIMEEGDEFLKKKKIKIPQKISSRINQTLSSTQHTLSMLSDFKKKRKLN